MSVLYKALARATKANEQARAEAEPEPAVPDIPTLPSSPRRARPLVRILLLALVSALAAVVGALYLYPEETALLVEEMTGTATVPLRSAPPPRPVGAPTESAAPKAEAEAESPAVPDAVAEGETSTPPPAPAAPEDDAAEAAPVNQEAAPAEAAAAALESVTAPLAQEPPLSLLHPASKPEPPEMEERPAGGDGAAPPAMQPTALAPGVIDLPAVIERIRRQQESAAMRPPVTVISPPAPKPASDGLERPAGSGVSDAVRVTEAQAGGRDIAQAAFSALLRGDHDHALELYDRALAASPRDAAVLLGRATALHKLGRVDEARAGYERVLAVDGENRAALTNLLSIIADEAPADALAELERLRRLNPAFSPVLAQMAQVQARLGDLPQAIRRMSEAVAMSPGNLLYLYNLAVLQDRAGLRGDAAATYERVLAGLRSDPAAAVQVPQAQLRERLRFLKSR